MNIELIKKYKAEFDWWLENQDKNVQSKVDGKWLTRAGTWERESVEAIVTNDEYAKFRMAEADGGEVEFKMDDGRWTWKDPNGKYTLPADRFRIKPSWKWQDEPSPEKRVICSNDSGEFIGVERVDPQNVAYADNGNYRCSVKRCKIEPITMDDLHPFQRKGYYSVEELEGLAREHNGHSGVSFVDWLKQKEAK
jgi:hypothetical protein